VPEKRTAVAVARRHRLQGAGGYGVITARFEDDSLVLAFADHVVHDVTHGCGRLYERICCGKSPL
jgi:hypothetical protein